MPISKALLKYGYSNFSLEILEYCESSETILREQYFLDLLNPEYNVLKIAGSTLGYKHSEEALAKIKAGSASLTSERIAKRLEQLKNLNASQEHKEHLKNLNSSGQHKEHLKNLHSQISYKVEIFDIVSQETKFYASIREAARSIGCHDRTIAIAFKHLKETGVCKVFKKRFQVKSIDEKS